MARRTVRRRWAVVAVACVAAGAALAGSGTAAATPASSPQSLAKAGMAEQMKSYNSSTGLIGDSWWQAAVALSTLETYKQATGDTEFDYAVSGAYTDNSGTKCNASCGTDYGDFKTTYMDDTGWWGLAWLQAYHDIGGSSYLTTAEDDAGWINSHRDSKCGGVLWNNTSSTNKAIANGVFLELSAWLYVTTGESKYLSWAQYEWSYFTQPDGVMSTGIVADGLNSSCTSDGGIGYTYNQGVVIAGLAYLYDGTGDSTYLDAAEKLATKVTTPDVSATCSVNSAGQASTSARYTPADGVLCDPAEGPSDPGISSFKGILVRGVKTLADKGNVSTYNPFLAKQACSIEAHDTQNGDQFGVHWAGPIDGVTSWSQASAIDALVAAIGIPSSKGGC